MEIYLLALSGALLHILFKFKAVIEKCGYQDAVKQFKWVMQIVLSAIGFISVCVIIYLRNDLVNIISITPVTAVVIGYIGDSVFKNIILKESDENELFKDVKSKSEK